MQSIIVYCIISFIWFVVVTVSIESCSKENSVIYFPISLLHGVFWPFSMIYIFICFIADRKE